MPAEVIYLRPEKVLFDTSIYISRLNNGRYQDLFPSLTRSAIVYLHSTVFEELLAGARTEKETRELHRLKRPFLGAGRLITPTDPDWEDTGSLINRMIGKGSLSPPHAVSLTHDILVALSARRNGIRVITENGKDFERIRSFKEFKLTVWSDL